MSQSTSHSIPDETTPKQWTIITAMESVLAAVQDSKLEGGKSMSWRKIADYIGCTRMKLMTYSEEVEALVERRWLVNSCAHEYGEKYMGFALKYGVVTALRHNKVFVPEKIDGMNEQRFMDYINPLLNNILANSYLIDIKGQLQATFVPRGVEDQRRPRAVIVTPRGA